MTKTLIWLKKLKSFSFGRVSPSKSLFRSAFSTRTNAFKAAFLLTAISFCNFASAQNLNYTTSWLGNSGAKNSLYIQQEIHALWVSPEGTSYGYSWFDEAFQQISVYSSSGTVQPHLTKQPFGSELGGNATKVFAAENNQLTGFLRSDGAQAGTVKVPGTFINGITANEAEVFVSSQNGNIYVYNASTLSAVRNFNVGTPRRLAIDGSGFLWVITGNTTLKRYSTTGELQSQSITLPSGNIAASVAINKSNNTIYIVDRGTDQNVKVYTNIIGSPTRTTDFGAVGGIFSGSRPGLVGPLRFHFNAEPNGDVPGHTINFNSIGVDNTGNIYVLHGMISGAHIEKYSPSGTMEWRLIGHTFEEGAYVDPTTDGTDVYAGAHHYKMNYSAPTEMATWYGNLAAINQANSYNTTQRGISFQGQSPVRIANIYGKKFMWMFAQQGELYVYRMDPDTEILANVGITDNENLTTWTRGSIIDVDANGAMWSGDNASIIEKYPCTGVTAAGVPIYNFNSPTTYAIPAPYSSGGYVGIEYIAETDVMYLSNSASTTRYNNWSTSRTLVWTKDLRMNGIEPASMSVAGDYIFTDYFSFDDAAANGRVRVWSVATGNFVFDMVGPANYTLHEADNILNTQAYKRSNGEYIITFIDHWNSKTVVFRWNPDGPLPLNLSSFTALINNKTNKLSWVTLNETNFKHFEVEKSADAINFTQFNLVDSKGNGNYSTTDNAPFNGNNYYRLKMVDLDGQYRYGQTIVIKNLLKETEYNIFPNPAKEVVTISTPDNSGGVSVCVLDLLGRKIYDSGIQKVPELKLNTSKYNKGIYFIRISGTRETVFKKLIVE